MGLKKINYISPQPKHWLEMDEDKVLFEQIVKGNDLAFEKLFRKYYELLCQFISQYAPDLDWAEEAVQDVFIKVWENRNSVVIHTSVKSYLYQSAKNRVLNSIRNEKKRLSHHELALGNSKYSVADSDEEDQLYKKLFMGIHQLPPKCAEIFKLSRLEGLTHAEIANYLNLKEKTVENQIGIALKNLRKFVSDFMKIGFILNLLNL